MIKLCVFSVMCLVWFRVFGFDWLATGFGVVAYLTGFGALIRVTRKAG